ncbi:MAG: hypothetical protein EPN22_02350 [Nitrospirae bacterium]|nr:MAG: hypothetical protein EPN22_02350 [Nitrospirota bacterium]
MKATVRVRKQFVLDPGKIMEVKKITKAKNDTEAINCALDLVIANSEVKKALASVKGKGAIRDVYARAAR